MLVEGVAVEVETGVEVMAGVGNTNFESSIRLRTVQSMLL